jgi:hypothetical protein
MNTRRRRDCAWADSLETCWKLAASALAARWASTGCPAVKLMSTTLVNSRCAGLIDPVSQIMASASGITAIDAVDTPAGWCSKTRRAAPSSSGSPYGADARTAPSRPDTPSAANARCRVSPSRASGETLAAVSAAYGKLSTARGRRRSPSESTAAFATARLRSTWICERIGSVYQPGSWSGVPVPISPARLCRGFSRLTADVAV